MSAFKKMKDAYHLKKDNFSLVPKLDWVCYFGRSEAESILTEMIEKSFSANVPPKSVVFGEWGTGKTQTIWHFINTILKDRSDSVYVGLPELPSNATFLDFYNILMNRLSISHFRFILNQVANKYGDIEKTTPPRGLTPNVITVFKRLRIVGEGTEAEKKIWAWLTGFPITRPDDIGLSMTDRQITITEALNVLWYLGTFNWEAEKKFMIFLIDEAQRLGEVKTGTFEERTFIEAFRAIFLKEFPIGLMFCTGIGELRDLPSMLSIGEVRSRIGRYISLGSLADPEIKEMIEGIVRYVRDGATWDYENGKIKWNETDSNVLALVARLKEEDIDTENEIYPFTKSAIEQLVQYFIQPEYITLRTPRKVCDCLDFIGSEREALEKGFIDKELIIKAFPKWIELQRTSAA